MPHALDRTLWLTADKDRVVEDGDPAAAYLLGAAGATIDDAEAERLGLTGKKAKAAPEETKAVSEPPEDKGDDGEPRRRGSR